MKHKSRIFEAVHETAKDLHELGFIDKRTLAVIWRILHWAGSRR